MRDGIRARLTPLPRSRKLAGDGVYSGGGFEERIGLPHDARTPSAPVGSRDERSERRRAGARETGFLVRADGTLDRVALARPGHGEAGARLDGLVALVFPEGCNVWTNFEYQQRRRSAEGSISLLIQREEVNVGGVGRAAPSVRQTEYFGGQILFTLARPDRRPPIEVLTSMASMLERSAAFAAELVRCTTADREPRLRAREVVEAMDVDGTAVDAATRDLCCVFAYTLKDNRVFAAAKARKIVLKFIVSSGQVELSYTPTPAPTPLAVARLIAPETFGCLAYLELDAGRTISRLSVFPDVTSLRDLPLNRNLLDARGQPAASRLYGPQGEVLPASTPGLDRYL